MPSLFLDHTRPVKHFFSFQVKDEGRMEKEGEREDRGERMVMDHGVIGKRGRGILRGILYIQV